MDTTTALKLAVRIDSNGKLSLYDKDNVQIGVGGTVLAQSTWYRVEVLCGTESAEGNDDGAYGLLVNDNVELSGNGNVRAVDVGYVVLGKYVNSNSEDIDCYYDDVAIDTSGYPGAGRIYMMLPDADTGTEQWNRSAGNDSYALVDDWATDAGATYISTGTSGHKTLFSMETMADRGISGTINLVKTG